MQIDYSHENEAELARLRRVIADKDLYIAKLQHSIDNQLMLNTELVDELKRIRGDKVGQTSIDRYQRTSD